MLGVFAPVEAWCVVGNQERDWTCGLVQVEAVEEHKVEQVVKRFSVQEFYAKAVREFMQASDSAGEKVGCFWCGKMVVSECHRQM